MKCLACGEQDAKSLLICEGCYDMLCTGSDDAIWTAEKYCARIAKLEATQQDLLRNLKNSGGSYYEMQQQYGVIFAENCELQGRIAELESKLATATELEEARLLEIDRLTEALNDSRQRDIARF